MMSDRFKRTAKSNLFDHLKPYRYILVSGPHRAGTTIAAAMIANDLDYNFVEDAQSELDLLQTYARQAYNETVFHCPTRCWQIHEYANIPSLAAVFLLRDLEAIVASQERIPWAFEDLQLYDYEHKARPKPTFAVQPPIATVKYRYWQEVQKPTFGERAFELPYETLRAHAMWVAPTQRKSFASNQIEIGVPHGQRQQGRRHDD